MFLSTQVYAWFWTLCRITPVRNIRGSFRAGGARIRTGDYYVWHRGHVLNNGTRAPPNNWVSAHIFLVHTHIHTGHLLENGTWAPPNNWVSAHTHTHSHTLGQVLAKGTTGTTEQLGECTHTCTHTHTHTCWRPGPEHHRTNG